MDGMDTKDDMDGEDGDTDYSTPTGLGVVCGLRTTGSTRGYWYSTPAGVYRIFLISWANTSVRPYENLRPGGQG